MDEKLWHWAYIDNPNGNPIVSLYFDGKRLVGHYAVVPVKFIFNQKNIDAVLSMSTMVDLSYRKYGVFSDQANDVYRKAIELGYKFVYGFPNKKSAPGFKKRLDWIIEDNLCVASFCYNDLKQIENKNYSNVISFNIENEDNLRWRLNKPNCDYFKEGGHILKEFGCSIDIVFRGINFDTLDKGKKYNLLLADDSGKYLANKEFDYAFGYKIFDPSFNNINFKKDLIMSDVF